MSFKLIVLEDFISNKKNLRKNIERFYSDKKLIRFYISSILNNYLYVEILLSN